jgi:hypothetical protein
VIKVTSGSAVPAKKWKPASKAAYVLSVDCHVFGRLNHTPVTTKAPLVGEACHLCKSWVIACDVKKAHFALKMP